MSKNKMNYLLCLLGLFYIALCMHLPVTILPLMPHDDGLFMRHAHELITGQWMGKYDQFTLMKGPAYSFFLAFNAFLGTPITLLLSLFYLLSTFVFIKTLRSLGLNNFFILIVFVLILFHPQLLPIRIIRDNFMPSLLLLIVSGFFYVLSKNPKEINIKKVFLFGFVLALFWLTREDSFWIIPAFLLLIIIRFIQIKKNGTNNFEYFKPLLVLISSAAIFVLVYSMVNYFAYGRFQSVDFKDKYFNNALEAMYKVKVEPDIAYLSVPYKKRLRLYEISPTFSKLKPFLEEEGAGFKKAGCEFYSWTCDDYANGWFMWALRDAVALAGFYDNPNRAANFYKDISGEIDAACKDGRIECRQPLISSIPFVTNEQFKSFPSRLNNIIKLITLDTDVPDTFGPSSDFYRLDDVRLFLGNPKTTLSKAEKKIIVNGWYLSDKKDWISMVCQSPQSNIEIERVQSHDVASVFNDPSLEWQRFDLKVLRESNCAIQNSDNKKIELNSLALGFKGDVVLGFSNFHFDLVSNNDEMAPYKKINPIYLKFEINVIYKKIVPLILALGLLSYLTLLIRVFNKRNIFNELTLVASVVWVLFVSRVVILIIVDTALFPAINAQYISSGFVLAIAASLISINALIYNFREEGKLR
jgi:hypothetical protein